MDRHFCVAVYIIDPVTKKILLVHHKKFDKWVQPGGHIEDNEILEEAAHREVYEETNLKIKLLGNRFPREEDFVRPLGIQKNRGKSGSIHIDVLYAAIPLNQEKLEIDKNEVNDAKWFSRKELDDENIFEDIKITYDHIIREYF